MAAVALEQKPGVCGGNHIYLLPGNPGKQHDGCIDDVAGHSRNGQPVGIV